MRVAISIPGTVAGTVLGATVRYGLTFSQVYHPGWFWWFQHGLRAPPGTAGFAGYVDTGTLMSNYESVGYGLRREKVNERHSEERRQYMIVIPGPASTCIC